MSIVNLREEILSSMLSAASAEAANLSSSGGVTISVGRGAAYLSEEEIGDRLYSTRADIAIQFNHLPAEVIVAEPGAFSIVLKFSVAIGLAIEKGQVNIMGMGFVEQVIAKAISAVTQCNRRVTYTLGRENIMSKHLVVTGEIRVEVDRGEI